MKKRLNFFCVLMLLLLATMVVMTFVTGADAFHEATIRAIRESEEMERHPERYKAYDDVDELFEDLEK